MSHYIGEGLFGIVKPRLVCSTWCLRRLKSVLGFHRKGPRSTRMGHGGTLDHLAGGVLVVGIGDGCKQLQGFLKGTKAYHVRAQLGVTTPSLDLGTRCSEMSPWRHVLESDIINALPKYRGKILQKPPMYSAKHKDGIRLYQLAQTGVEVDRARLPVEVFEIQLTEFEPPFFSLTVKCSSGFYVRQLVHEIGEDLGCGAIAYTITRTQQGPFTLRNTLSQPQWTRENVSVALKYL